jgi:hypothetical protein
MLLVEIPVFPVLLLACIAFGVHLSRKERQERAEIQAQEQPLINHIMHAGERERACMLEEDRRRLAQRKAEHDREIAAMQWYDEAVKIIQQSALEDMRKLYGLPPKQGTSEQDEPGPQ